MSAPVFAPRLAVCSWSLRPATPQALLTQLQATGLRRVQLALDPLRETPAVWADTEALLRQHGVALVSGMFGCVGEDYTSLDSIRATGGLAPDATWPQNERNLPATIALAQRLKLKLVTFHAGFLPHEPGDPQAAKLLGRLAQVADAFAAAGMALALETGQETAATLRQVLQTLNRPNLGVNFDPANMILYAQGNPVAALRELAPWIRQVHLKDARRTQVPGTWGEEVPVGTGDVDWRAFFQTLQEIGFTGDCCFEREAGEQRVADIRAAREFVERLGG